MLAGKSRGGTPFCRTLKIVFPKNISVATVLLEQLQDICLLLRFHKTGRSCSPCLEKLSLFSPPAPCAKRMAQGFHCLRLVIENTSPRKIIRIRFGKAGAHPQLAWESQLPLKPCILITTFCFEGNCDSFDLLLDFCYSFICKFDLLRKCGLLAHTSAAFLKNCCTEKLFGCLRQKNCRQFDLAAILLILFCSYFIQF